MLTVSFRGMCAFRKERQKQVVLAPEVHGHVALMIARADDIDLTSSKKQWWPSFSFFDPANASIQFYAWRLTGRKVRLGNVSVSPTWTSTKRLADLRERHPNKKAKASGKWVRIQLGQGSLSPKDPACFEWLKDGKPTGQHELLAERVEWVGTGRRVVSDVGRIKTAGASAAFAISNTLADPDGLAHFDGYYALVASIAAKDKQGLRPSNKCGIRTTAAGAGDCVPNVFIP